MSSMGTSVAQSIAGAQQAAHSQPARPAKTDGAKVRQAIRTGDQVELSTELVDAVGDAANTTDEQPRQQQHQQPPADQPADAKPHIDLQA